MKMFNKWLLVLLVLILITSKLEAQESDMSDRKFRFGLMATPNLGWIRPNIQDFKKDNLESRLGFGYGLMVDYKFSESPNYLLSTGVNLTSNGGGLQEPYDSLYTNIDDSTTYFYGRVDRTYRLQYVNIPIQLKMRTNDIGYLTYFGAIGFDLGILTRAFADDQYYWEQPGLIEQEDDKNIRSNINLFRLAINLTGGAEFNISGNTNAYIGIGWHNAFTNMFKKSASNRILEPEADGTPVLENGVAVLGRQKKAVTNYVSIDFGIFF